jgi:peptidoglycan/LPS O-acetylase OafA/YrhL
MRKGFSSNLDLLRAIAVLLVLIQHLCRRTHIEHISWIPTTSLGYFGVLLFFVHTSLVLMYSLERTRLTGPALFVNFYIRRIFRMYPLSILAVLVAVALHLESDINGTAGLSVGTFPGKYSVMVQLLLVQNLVFVKSIVNVLWSLPFEMQMYIFLPLLFIWIQGKRMLWPLLLLWAVSVVAAVAQTHIHALSRLSLLAYVPNFLPGVIAYNLPHRVRLKSFLWPIFVLLLILVFTTYPALGLGWALCLILGLLIPCFGEITTAWLRVAANRIATYSYGIYISHQFCIWIALGLLASHSRWLKLPLLIALLVTLPLVLYHAIEKPMINLGARLARRWSERALAVPETA